MSGITSTDSRGKVRGACSKNGCDCSCYGWDKGKDRLKCINCSHPPGIHQMMSTDGILSGDVDRTTPSNPISKSHAIDTSENYDDEKGTFPDLKPTPTSPPPHRRRSRFRSMKEIEYALPTDSDVFHRSKDFIDIPPERQCPRCGREKWRNKDGTYLDYCGKACRDAHSHFQTLDIPPEQQCPRCGREKWRNEDGTYLDYCGKTCRDAHSHFQSSGSMHPATLMGTGKCCNFPGCTKRRAIDPETGVIHDFCGKIHAAEATKQGIYIINIKSASQNEFGSVSEHFRKTWAAGKGQYPKVNYVFAVTNAKLNEKWKAYRSKLQDSRVEKYFHGTVLSCDLVHHSTLCKDTSCGICGISQIGFDPGRIRSNIEFQRFGHGFYLAPNSSKCHDYTQGTTGYRALLLCDVCPGIKYECKRGDAAMTKPPSGYDCVYGRTGGDLNYEEITLFHPDAILPKYIIIYVKNGVKKLI